MRVTFLTPRLPPAVCGVGDHTRNLAQAMAEEGVEVGFIHREPFQSGGKLPAGPVDRWLDTPASLIDCVKAQQPDWLWIQLSGYGYSRWGAPFALSRAVKAVRRALPETRLAVYAHETHCRPRQLGLKGPLLSPWQRYTAASVAGRADVVFTSISRFAHQIVQEYGVAAEKVVLLPIGSALPCVELGHREREQIRRRLGWNAEEVVAITFGLASSQIKAIEDCGPCLVRGIESGKLHRIVCIGGHRGEVRPEFARWARGLRRPDVLEVMGHQTDRTVAEMLACADLAFVYHSPSRLGKSSVFSAFALAGLPVLVARNEYNGSTGETLPPYLPIESWDWSHARSPWTDQFRETVRQYALDHFRWEKIASGALCALEAAVEPGGLATEGAPRFC